MVRKLFFIMIFVICSLFLSSQSILNKEIINKIDQSVFEVVIEKLYKDSLTYEKELPVNNIPFSFRNDKYLSIGTAFAVSDNTFLSAAHVFSLDNESQYKKYFLRDKQNNVYEVDQVIKYSNHKDFILFTLKDKKVINYLNINYSPELNEDVFAVGNAFGEGIIIRNGILTSKTPEKSNGEWEWLRFSAAASPGNSGGPLLDKNGSIIGLITMKSSNENLNYALPLKELQKEKKNIAVIKHKFLYSLLNANKKSDCVYDFITYLPKNYMDLCIEIDKNMKEYIVNILNSIIDKNKNSIFPEGKGSLNLLYSTYTALFPRIIGEGDDGNWDAYYPKDIKSSDLSNNGFIEYGNLMDIDIVYLRKPDNISLIEIYKDSKLYMDMILKGISMHRTIMNEKIRITSLGKAYASHEFYDNYKRKWLVQSWHLEYNDSVLLSFSLIVPNGVISMIKIDQTGNINTSFTHDMKFLCNFIYVSYYGTFSQWNDFFSNKDYLPESFKKIDFIYENNHSVNLKTDRFALSYGNKLFSISDSSELYLKFSYFMDKGQIVWDISGIVVGENKDNKNFFSLSKKLKAVTGLKDEFFSEWDKITCKQYPYNNSSQSYEGSTYIYKLHSAFEKSDIKQADFIYFTVVGLEGKISEVKIKQKIKDVNSSINILEH